MGELQVQVNIWKNDFKTLFWSKLLQWKDLIYESWLVGPIFFQVCLWPSPLYADLQTWVPLILLQVCRSENVWPNVGHRVGFKISEYICLFSCQKSCHFIAKVLYLLYMVSKTCARTQKGSNDVWSLPPGA